MKTMARSEPQIPPGPTVAQLRICPVSVGRLIKAEMGFNFSVIQYVLVFSLSCLFFFFGEDQKHL
jgi:hypothetical protein